MIETNLLGQKRTFKTPTVLGVDLSKINFKMLALAMVIYYVPEGYLISYFEEQMQEVQRQIEELNTQIAKLDKELEGTGNLREKLEAFNRQVLKLQERSEQVDRIVKERTNPAKLLEQLAKNTPEDLWMDELVITGEKEIIIKGGAESYKSIGDFLTHANDSPFFGKTLTLADSKTSTENLNGKEYRREDFEIKGKITIFDPWMQ
ncbi:MAG: hypothetical protein Fur0010_17510 [Bdellovibrio sp.]